MVVRILRMFLESWIVKRKKVENSADRFQQRASSDGGAVQNGKLSVADQSNFSFGGGTLLCNPVVFTQDISAVIYKSYQWRVTVDVDECDARNEHMQVDVDECDARNEREDRHYTRVGPAAPVPSSKLELVRLLQDKKIPKPRKIEIVCSFIKDWEKMICTTADGTNFEVQITKADMGMPQFVSFLSEWVQHGILWSFKCKDDDDFPNDFDVPPHRDYRYWNALGCCLSSKDLPQSATVSPGLMRCLDDFVGYRNDEDAHEIPWMSEDTIKSIETLLLANQRSFRPELDHWISLAVTALKQLTFNDEYFAKGGADTCRLQHRFFISVLEGFSQFIAIYPNRKKTFIAIVERLLDPLLSARAYVSLPKYNAFLTPSSDLFDEIEVVFTDEVKDWQKRLLQVTKEILNRGLFHPVHIGSFHSVCSFLPAQGNPISDGRKMEVASEKDRRLMKKAQDERDMASYQKRLFRKLDQLKQEHSLGLTQIGGLFEAYSQNLTASQAADALEVFGLNAKGKLQVPPSKGSVGNSASVVEEETSKVGGTPSGVQQFLHQKDQYRETRFAVFAELAGPILIDLQRCWSPTKRQSDESRQNKQPRELRQGYIANKTAQEAKFHLVEAEVLLSAFNGLLKAAVKERTYVPTEDNARQTHFTFLLKCFSVVVEFGNLLPGLLNDPDIAIHENTPKPGVQGSRVNMYMPVLVNLLGSLLREIFVMTGYLLEMEYRVADSKLDDVWAILLHGAILQELCEEKEQAEVTNQEAVKVACQLITTYSDLRQVDRVLFPLCKTLRMFLQRPSYNASQDKPWRSICSPESSGFFVGATRFLPVVASAIRSLPEGQVAEFMRGLTADTMESMSALGADTGRRQGGMETRTDYSRTYLWCQIGLIELYSCILENVNVTPTNCLLCCKSVNSLMKEVVTPDMGELIDSCLMHEEDITESPGEGEKGEVGKKEIEKAVRTWNVIFKLRLFLSSRDLHKHCLHLIPSKAVKKANQAHGGYLIDYHKLDVQSVISRLSAGMLFSAVGRDSVKVSDVLAGLRVKMSKDELSDSPELQFTVDRVALQSLVELARHVEAVTFLVTKCTDVRHEDRERASGSLLGGGSKTLSSVAAEGVDVEVSKKLKKLSKSLKQESRRLAKSLLQGLSSLSDIIELHTFQLEAASELRAKSRSELTVCTPCAAGDPESQAVPVVLDVATSPLTLDSFTIRRWRLLCQTFDVWAKFAAETDLKNFLTCLYRCSMLTDKNDDSTRRKDDEPPGPEVTSMQQVANDVLTNATFFEEESIRGVFASSLLETFKRLVCFAYGNWPFEWFTCGSFLEKETLINVASEFSDLVEAQVGEIEEDVQGGSEARKLKSLVKKRKKWKIRASKPDMKTLRNCVALLDRLSAVPPGYVSPGEAARCAFAIQCFERILVQDAFYERLNLYETEDDSKTASAGYVNVLLVLECLCSCRNALVALAASPENENHSECSLLTVLSGSVALIQWPSQSLHATTTCLVDIVEQSSLSDEEKLNKLYSGQILLHIALKRTATLLTYIYTGSLRVGAGAGRSDAGLSDSSTGNKDVVVRAADGNNSLNMKNLGSVDELLRSQGIKIDKLLHRRVEAEEMSSSGRPQKCTPRGLFKSWFSGLVFAASLRTYLWSLVSSFENSAEERLTVENQRTLPLGSSGMLDSLKHTLMKTLVKALVPDGSHAMILVGEKEIDRNFQWTAREVGEEKNFVVCPQASQDKVLNQKNGDAEESDEDELQTATELVHHATVDTRNGCEEEEEEGDEEDMQGAELVLKEEDQGKVSYATGLRAADLSKNSARQRAALEILFETRSMGKCEIVGELYLAAAAVLKLEALKLSHQEASNVSGHLPPGGNVLLGAGYWILLQAAKRIRSANYAKFGWLIGVVKYFESLGRLLSHMKTPLTPVAFSKLFDMHLYILGSLSASGNGYQFQRSPQPLDEFDQLEPSPGLEAPSSRIDKDEAKRTAEYTLRDTVISSLRLLIRTASRHHSVLALQAITRSLVGASEVSHLASGLQICGRENGNVGRGVAAGVESLAIALEAVSGTKRLRLLANHLQEFAGAIFSVIEYSAGPNLFLNHEMALRPENKISMVESGPVLQKCIQILTNVASREIIFPLGACHVALALHCPSVIFSPVYQSGLSRNRLIASSLTRDASGIKHVKEEYLSVLKIGSDVGVELYVACCRLLCSLIRHRRRESGHCIALLGDSARVLLHCLEKTYWPFTDESTKVWSTKMATYCAIWLRRIYEELSEHKETLGKYCCHILSHYLSVLAGHWAVGVGLTREVEAALRPGAYALVDACSANDLQQLHASLGEGPRRNALLALRREYTQQFKYTGKV
ncbi:hypothetical protein R1flu_014563 [Riccia fluitans]|uniref:Nucleolar 27S pre-rRNA processing Urb2/Npa2 C-terminal domain-containing protein n=1 Tax=Riccia fluitans TaxID=41844 RepID=A0ABD1YJJ9_9MARC